MEEDGLPLQTLLPCLPQTALWFGGTEFPFRSLVEKGSHARSFSFALGEERLPVSTELSLNLSVSVFNKTLTPLQSL